MIYLKHTTAFLVSLIGFTDPLAAEWMTVFDIVNGDTLNVRSGPGTSHRDIGDLKKHQVVNVLGYNSDGTWAHIKYRGQMAWISTRHLSPDMHADNGATGVGPHLVTVIAPNDPDRGLNVRGGGGTDHAVIGVLPNDEQIHVIERSRDGKWAMIAFGPGVGWVRATYIVAAQGHTQHQAHPEPVPSATPNTAPEGLPLPAIFSVSNVPAGDVFNIRSEPHSNAQIIHMVANGIPITVLGMASGNWAKVKIQDTIGFAHMNFMTRGGGTTTPTGLQLGIECLGTEPFWHMSIATDSSVTYTTNGQTTAPVALQSATPSTSQTGYPYGFMATPFSGQIDMQICSDGMSDDTYPMSATINAFNEFGAPMVALGCCRLQ